MSDHSISREVRADNLDSGSRGINTTFNNNKIVDVLAKANT